MSLFVIVEFIKNLLEKLKLVSYLGSIWSLHPAGATLVRG